MADEDSYSIKIDERSDEKVPQLPLHVGSPNEIEMTDHLQQVPDSKEETEIGQTPHQVNGSETLPESATQEPLFGRGWPIFRVPAHVREVEKGAYTPKIISIGPFHRNEPSLRALELQKQRFLSRLQNQNPNTFQVLENAMKEMEKKTRNCYAEGFEGIKSDDFVDMMLLDGCFIVELLRLYANYSSEEKFDAEEPILEKRWMVPNIGRDLLMLENQLPLFLLHKIFDVTTLEREGATPLNKLALRFFEPLRPGKDEVAADILNAEGKYPHLLALFQSTFNSTPNENRPSRPGGDNLSKYEKIPGKGWVHNAKTLTYAGVRFEKKSGNFLDIEYKNSKLKIPTLFIDDGTSTLLRNLIAYEQSNRCAEPYFSCLAVFMDSIVDTVDDINILRRAGIIKQPKGGDQEVVNLFNSLSEGVEIDMDDCYILEQIKDINSHCQSHENMVRFHRFLSAINLTVFNDTYTSILLTLIFIWFLFKHGNNNQSNDRSAASAPR